MLIATSDAANARVLAAAVADAARSGWRLHIGVGEPVAPEHLDRSAASAREALAYGVSGGADGVTRSSDLGAIQLLARIPPGDVQRNADVAAIANLADAGAGVSDLTLLMTYCETGTMRKTGERLALHHSSVEYRLRRIEELLGFSVSTPGGRFRAQVGIMVVRMMRTGDIV
jgi:sugar diacid utilization regulator